MISPGRPVSRLASVLALLLAFAPFCTAASAFDIGLDGKSPYPAHSRDHILELQRNSDGRSLRRDELDAFKAVLVQQGWPTYRTSGPALIDAAGKLLERSGLDFEFQEYMLRVLDQQVGDDIRLVISVAVVATLTALWIAYRQNKRFDERQRRRLKRRGRSTR